MSNQRATQGGNVFCSDGEVFNWGDDGRLKYKYNLLRQTIENGAVEFGKRCPVLSAVSTTGYFYGLTVPEGRRLYIWRRDLELTEGRYEVDYMQYPDGFTGGVEAYKQTLTGGATPSVTAQIFCGVTPVGAGTVIMETPLIDTGTAQTGQARAGGAGSIEGVLKSFTGDTVLIRVRRTEAANFTSSLSVIAWEDDA